MSLANKVLTNNDIFVHLELVEYVHLMNVEYMKLRVVYSNDIVI